MVDVVSWDPTPAAGWGDTVDSWTWGDWLTPKGTRLGWVKSGVCPRCGHTIAVYQQAVVQFAVARAVEDVMALCNCALPHPLRPPSESVVGCGQHAEIKAAP